MGEKRIIYMDHSATTYVRKEVVEAMAPYYSEHFGNPSSIYSIARESKQAIDTARAQVAMALGAEGVQIGTRFAASVESSAHPAFKQRIVETPEGGTMLALKAIGAVRLIRNRFFDEVAKAESRGATPDELRLLLGKGRAKLGMFEGNLNDGELEIGQVSSLIDTIMTVDDIMQEIISGYEKAKKRICTG